MLSIWLVILSVPAAVLPTMAYVLFTWWVDRYEKEPWRLLLVTFLWGALPATVLAVIIELAFDAPLSAILPRYSEFIGTSIVGPVVEEALKAVALLAIYALARYEFDGILDGIIYGSLVGFGFAMTENLLYFWGKADAGVQSWISLVLVRALIFGLNHALYTSFTGIGISLAVQARSISRRWGLPLLGFGVAVMVHFFHNAFLMLASNCLPSFLIDWLGVGLVLAMIVLAWRREKRWLVTFLQEEVEAGLVTPEQMRIITSWRRRLLHRLRKLGVDDRAHQRAWHSLVRDATELAFKKRQYAQAADEALGHQIEDLRRRIQEEGLRL